VKRNRCGGSGEITVHVAVLSGRETGGKAAWAWVAVEENTVVGNAWGEASPKYGTGARAAGYVAVLRCLEYLRITGCRPWRVVFCVDDALLVRQLSGSCPLLPAEVLPLKERIEAAAAGIPVVEFREPGPEEKALASKLLGRLPWKGAGVRGG
jgi:hypothetical protein